ncbi:CPBP family intramembrane glutamic endopeptidase [Nonomuraea diastatica]|nr:CPBP family intramembrane glutamic endopeptidase [Nonomuraea diastatica]
MAAAWCREAVMAEVISMETDVWVLPVAEAKWWARPMVRLLIMIALLAGVTVVVNAIAAGMATGPVGGLAAGGLGAAFAMWAYAMAVRATERRHVMELLPGREEAASTLWRWTLAGLALFTVTIGVIAVFGGYRIAGWGSIEGAVTVFGTMCAVAVVEELLFRGVLFRIVEEMAGTWGALLVSGVLFGALHLVNPGATGWGALAIAIEAGLMLGAAYAATRNLWVPIGLHLGWNAAEAGIFGVTVSGSGADSHGLLEAAMSGPAALTGGAFGPEASVVAILVCSVPTVLFLRMAHRRGHLHRRPRPSVEHEAV